VVGADEDATRLEQARHGVGAVTAGVGDQVEDGVDAVGVGGQDPLPSSRRG
jgi:hypothetical protein